MITLDEIRDIAAALFTPELPARRVMLQRAWNNGTESKLFAVYESPFWRDEGLSGQALTDLPVARFVIDNSPPDASVGNLLTFLPTHTHSRTTPLDDPESRRAAFVADLTTIFGERAAQPSGYLEKTWHTEPWIDGCVSARPPGVITECTDATWTPIDDVHWAGTETATINEGYLDGAVRAGERAATEVDHALTQTTGAHP